MRLDKNQLAFFALVKAGLWEQDTWLSSSEIIDYKQIYQIADGQSVIGIVAAGLEHIKDTHVPREDVLQFVGHALHIEQRNKAMNSFLGDLIKNLREKEVYAILVKGQGIAQCYEKPLWRASGDIDLLLSDTNYERAKQLLLPQAIDVEVEYKSLKHIGMTMPGGFVVELHGTLHSRLSRRIDRIIDKAQKSIFLNGNVRIWQNGNTQIFLPSPDNDVRFVFTHILHHFFIEGVGLRQICDWCRLLWTLHDKIDVRLLESRIKEAGLISEWKAFASFSVDWLGMPLEAMPLYSPDKKWSNKAERILDFMLECGNFGHNRHIATGKISSAWYKMRDFVRHSLVFPVDSVKFFFHFLCNGIGLAVTKEKRS